MWKRPAGFPIVKVSRHFRGDAERELTRFQIGQRGTEPRIGHWNSRIV